jgi:hypothetical protein
MVRWKLGEHDEAHRWYASAVEGMKTKPNDVELRRFCSEAATLLGLPEPAAPPNEESYRPEP